MKFNEKDVRVFYRLLNHRFLTVTLDIDPIIESETPSTNKELKNA
jgi:hypothetical protein